MLTKSKKIANGCKKKELGNPIQVSKVALEDEEEEVEVEGLEQKTLDLMSNDECLGNDEARMTNRKRRAYYGSRKLTHELQL